MNRALLLLMALMSLCVGALAAGSLTLSLSSLDAITVGESATLVATVSASGDSVSNTQASITLPSGLTTSDSTTQSIGTLSSGQSTTKQWNITGNTAGSYTITITATGDSVTAQTSTATLTVSSPGNITVATQAAPTTDTVASGSSVTLSLLFSNTGGSSSTVTAAVTPTSGLTMSSGNATNSFDLNGGQSNSLSWVFLMGSTNNQTITVSISSTTNTPSYTSSYTIAGSGPAAQSPGGSGIDTNTASTTSGNAQTTGGNTAGSGSGPNAPGSESPGASGALTVADIENSANIVKKTDYEPSVSKTADGLQVTKAASYVEAKNSAGAAIPAYVFNVGIKNTTSVPLSNVKVRETIPKAIASNVSQITFKDAPKVINPDPVVEWTVASLQPGEEKKFVYFVTKLADQSIASSFGSYVKTLPSSKAQVVLAGQEISDGPQAKNVAEALGLRPESENTLLLAVGGVVGLIVIGVIIAAILFVAYWFFLRHK